MFVICILNQSCLNTWQTDGVATQCSHLIDAACEVLSAPSLAEVFWEMVRTADEMIHQIIIKKMFINCC